MRKLHPASRLLAFILALAMILPMIPGRVLPVSAAIGDIAVGDKVGDTGLSGNIDTTDTISWPIRIYDYLNDGMLFEFANDNSTGTDIPDEKGGAYGGGTPAPHMGGAQTVIGTDYTVAGAYTKSAYVNNFQNAPYWTASAKVAAKNFVAPMHLRLVLDSNYSNMFVTMSDFSADNGGAVTPESARYVVIAYRTNGMTDRTIEAHWNFAGHHSSAQTFKASSEWTYMVYDMYTGDTKTNWSTYQSTKVGSVQFKFPLTTGSSSQPGANYTGEYIDISHIAYFDTEFEANQFGIDAVAFDKNPGEFLDAHTEYTSEPVQIPVAKPDVGGNGSDFTDPSSSSSMNGYNIDETYKSWKTATNTGLSYLGTVNGITVKEVDNGLRSYVQLNNSNNSSHRSIYIWNYSGGAYIKSSLCYVTLVYKTTGFTGDDKIAFFAKNNSGGGTGMHADGISGVKAAGKGTLKASNGKWTYVTYDVYNLLANDLGSVDYTYTQQLGLYLPACLTGSANANKSLDIAMIDIRSTNNFNGQQAADYMNGVTTTSAGNSYTTAQKKWNTGNNVAFGMLWANQGGGWTTDGVNGGSNSWSNGYWNYQIGIPAWSSTANTTISSDRQSAKNQGYTVADDIYTLHSWGMADQTTGYYDMSKLDFSYTLYNQLYEGVMTAGLLESSITTVVANGKNYRVPQYKEETIEYIAFLLRNSLCIGQTDASGNYNYNFVQGTPNGAQYGYAPNGEPYDLASALRAQLGISLPANGGNCDVNTAARVGDYAQMTDAQKASLIGSFESCKGNINTFVDAAYYLLMNLYIDYSYNQPQDEYKYLVLSAATFEDGKTGYVFDGGFTTGNVSETANTDAYRNSSKSATVYDKTNQSIYQNSASSKDQIYYANETSSATTRFPFLPVTDAEGVYAGGTNSPYFLDEAAGVMGVTEEGSTFANRNYNYAIASNGEFIYYEEDDLFFDFQGDDDVYLFINGELVVDVGAAHSVTIVNMKVSDYVTWAKNTLAGLDGYDPAMTNREVEELLNSKNLSAEKKAEYLRAHRLNLQDGEVCQFDFYYMERHGWGANCRIASNIRVTEPEMRVEKKAYQGGDEIAYSDVIVASDPVEYNFKITNNGSSKLFNLTFTDSTIGVTLDYTNGLTVADGMNGIYLFDANGGTLEASDLTALVTGWMPVTSGGTHSKSSNGTYVEDENGTHVYTTVSTTFKDQQALINFLAYLQGEGLDNEELDTSNIQSGYGLWVDADVTIKGMYYQLSAEQIQAGVLDNTVYVTASSMPDTTLMGNQMLQSQARHRVYVTGLPYYYQWAGHDLYLPINKVLDDSAEAAKDSGNQAHEYENYLSNMGNMRYVELCDKFGVVTTYGEEVKEYVVSGDPLSPGYIVNFKEPGTRCFYILISSEVLSSTSKAKDLPTGKYAIVRITVFVADVKDSYYVLDYGLATEDLGTDGELFKDDYLFGGSSNHAANMMGVSTIAPSYLSYPDSKNSYNRIDFSPVADNTSIPMADGYYTMNIENGKDISFNSFTGEYSLNQVGTAKVNVYTPIDWTTAYLYFWYDGGRNNGWPGERMERITAGQYTMDIPGDITHVIISNGTKQTSNLLVTPGLENTIVVTDNGDPQYLQAEVETFAPVTMNVTFPQGFESWDKVYIYSFNSASGKVNGEWPGFEMDAVGNGVYTHNVPGEYDRAIITNGQGLQTNDLWVTAGANANIEMSYAVTANVSATDWGDVWMYAWNSQTGENNASWPGVYMNSDGKGNYVSAINGNFDRIIINNGNGAQTVDLEAPTGTSKTVTVKAETDNDKHLADITAEGQYTAHVSTFSNVVDTYPMYVSVPAGWDTPHIYYWNSNGVPGTSWPGVKLTTKNEDGLYVANIPVDSAYVIINNGEGSHQTVDLSVKLGVEAVVTVTNPGADSKYLGTIDYNDQFTFTPNAFMDDTYSIWMAISVHNRTMETPTALGNDIDETLEVQLYKKISVLPANVVYYEDDFPAITYETTSGNVFTEIGSSSDLSQSVDQDQEYGQDDAYKNNGDMSGSSLHVIEIKNANVVASFPFTGTGFELISRTNACDSSSILLEVWDSSNTVIKRIPVITQFDNNETGNTPGGKEAIYQVPVIRVDGLAYGQYTVKIKGVPSSTYAHTYLYIDGIRIFQPLGTTNDHYNEAEKDVSFTEIRDLIVTGKAAVAQYDGDTMSVSSGLVTWTENLSSKPVAGLQEFHGNQVSNVNEYLLRGPNNEVYMNGTIQNASLVFTVKKTSSAPTLQIAIRAIDEVQFYIGSSAAPTETVSGLNTVIEFYARQSDGSFAWEPFVTITSGTEQYYAIDLTRCYAADGEILVAVRAASGMASFTSLKHSNLTIEPTAGAEATNYYYINGELALCSCEETCSAKNTDCVLCTADYEKCQALTVAGEEYEEVEGGIQLAYMSYMMRRPSLSDTMDAPEIEIQPEDPQPDVTPYPEDQPQQTPDEEPEVTPGTTPEVDSGAKPEEKPADQPANSGTNKPSSSGNNKPSTSGSTPSSSNIAAQVAAKVAAIQNSVADARNHLKSFVGEFAALFR